MRIGIVCPYDWSVPGGVQAHIQDLALELMDRGHYVNVLSPVSQPEGLPEWVTNGGEPVAISYNGSVARISFGLRANRRVRKWIREQKLDVMHVHEPLSPSLSALACWSATGPIVGTFHSSMDRSRIMAAGYGVAQTVLEKVTARIAVSELARNTVVQHVGGDAVLIPNGVHVNNFTDVTALDGQRNENLIAFLGRFEEPRKGFPILLKAFESIADEMPEVSLVVAGPGDAEAALEPLRPDLRQRVRFLGRVSDQGKAEMLSGAGVYVAPNTGGESFGIVLLEAMACHTPVIASDLPAFVRVLDYGTAGVTFTNEDIADCARALREVLGDPGRRAQLAEAGFERVQLFDWSRVATSIIDVYETVSALSSGVQEDFRSQIVGRLAPESQ